MVDIRAEVDELVRQFVDDLEQLVRRAALESVAEALEAEPVASPTPAKSRPAKAKSRPAKAKSRPAKAKSRPAKAKSRRRAAPRSKAGKEQLARALVDYVTEHPSAKMEDIKVAIGEETLILRPIVNKLIKNGHLRKEGERRATRYFPGEGG